MLMSEVLSMVAYVFTNSRPHFSTISVPFEMYFMDLKI